MNLKALKQSAGELATRLDGDRPGQILVLDMIAEISRLQRVIERDRSNVTVVLNNLDRAVGRRNWLREPARGSFAYDDETYQLEFGHALDEIEIAMKPLSAHCMNWYDCPVDPKE